jgi:hypothetical protein
MSPGKVGEREKLHYIKPIRLVITPDARPSIFREDPVNYG